MRNRWFILPILVLISLLVVPLVAAQGSTTTQAPGTWSSSINIQNTGDAAATVVLTFHNSAGAAVLSHTVSPPIAAGGSRSLYVPMQIPGLADGQYSVIASSDQPLQIVANASSVAPATAGAYSGLQSDEIGKTLFFPGLYNAYYGFYSQLVLQNTESTAATVTITFYNQNTGAQVAQITGANIPATSTRVFALPSLAGVPSGNVNGLLSAKVTSDRDLAGIANIWTSARSGAFADYNGYVAGSTDVVYAPALYKNYYGFVSALTVQNLSAGPANIRVTYSNGTIETRLLQPNQSVEYYQPNNAALPSGNVNGVFSAKVESLDGAEIVVLVNVEDKNKGLLASYNGPSTATDSVNLPVVLKAFYNWFSAQTVQNVGNGPTNITITYAGGQTRTFNNVPANGTVNIIELDSAGSVLPNTSSVSAVVTSSAQPIVAVVQQNSEIMYRQTPGDYLLAYTGIAR